MNPRCAFKSGLVFLIVIILLIPQHLSGQHVQVRYFEPIASVFDRWQEEWGFELYYSPSLLDTSEVITFVGSGSPERIIEQYLTKAYIQYRIEGKKVLIGPYRKVIRAYGVIREDGSDEPLPYANVFVPSIGVGTTANAYGFYSLELPLTQAILQFSYIGYAKKIVGVSGRGDFEFNIWLEPRNILQETIITDQNQPFIMQKDGIYQLKFDEVSKIPSVGNENDLIRAFQTLPGVQNPTDISNGMMVRGGAIDQNLIMIDDAPVYNSSHLLGFFSIFNTESVKAATLSKTGFAARHGGRLSSVLDVQTREGNRQKMAGRANLGSNVSGLAIEGPIKAGASSYYFSARRSNLGYIRNALANQLDPLNLGYYFFDVNLKVNVDLGEKRKAYFSLYHGEDFLRVRELDEFSLFKISVGWNNLIGSFRLNRIFNEKLFGNLTLHYSRYRFNHVQEARFVIPTFGEQFSISRFDSDIEDWSARYDLDFFFKSGKALRIGMQGIYHRFKPDRYEFRSNREQILGNDISTGNLEFAIYAETDWQLTKSIILEFGSRISGLVTNRFYYLNPEPRLSFVKKLKNNQILRLNYDRMVQYVRLFSQNSIGIPVYVWLPSEADLAPPVADHIGLIWQKTIFQKNLISVEPYAKYISRQVFYYPNFSLLSFFSTGGQFQTRGNAIPFQTRHIGIDFMHEYKGEKVSLRSSYSLSYNQMQNLNWNRGNWFYTPNDRRHDFSIAGSYHQNANWQFNCLGVYSSGNPLSLPSASYTGMSDPSLWTGFAFGSNGGIAPFYQLFLYDQLANFRTPAYIRVDISTTYSWKVKQGQHKIDLSIYNLLNRANAFTYIMESNDQNQLLLKQIAAFPILPSLSYQFKW